MGQTYSEGEAMSCFKFLILTVVTGALMLSACGSTPGNGPINVDVSLNEFTVESSMTNLKPGVPYHFRIQNEGQIAHEFMIMPASDQHNSMPGMRMEEHHEDALLIVPAEQLPPGAAVEVDYTFSSVPDQPVEIVCRLPGHYEAGMYTPISFE
jgi:uncharacterized cupredoxin-like copper-binding protein